MRRAALSSLCAAILWPAAALAQGAGPAPVWSGFSLGVGVGGAFGTARSDLSGDIPVSSAFGAIYGGYDYQLPGGLVVGLQLGISPLHGLFGNKDVLCPASLCAGLPAINAIKTEVSWFADIRPRVGYAIGRFLPYVTAGFGFGEAKSTLNTSLGPLQLAHQVVHSNLRGAVFGAGVQYAVTRQVSLDAAYLRADANANRVPGGHFDSNAFRVGVAFRF